MSSRFLLALASLLVFLPTVSSASDLNAWGIPTAQVSYAGYGVDFDEEHEHPLKVCKKGKPCGNTCISMSYTCHVGTTTTYIPPTYTTGTTSPTTTTSTSTGITSGSSSGTTTTPTAVWTASADTVAIKPPTPTTGCVNVKVLTVIDGDTVSVLNESGQVERVRVDQIDAPERSQTYGLQATQCLSALVQNTASIQMCRDGNDRYGRTIADLISNGADVGSTMVRSGCAWAYTKYLEQGSNLPALQATAQASGVGLWASGSTVAPWIYRAGGQPVQVSAATATPVIPVSSQTMASDWDRLFDWVEHRFPDATRYGSPTTNTNGIYARCYQGGTCISYVNGRIVITDPNGQAVDVGGSTDFLPVAQADGF